MSTSSIPPDTAPEPSAVRLTANLFGPMQVWVRGQPLPHLRSRKALWLLALLILKRGESVSRPWLAGTLWPDIDQTQAFANLRPVLSALRQALGDEGERLRSASRSILSLDLANAQIDLLEFDAAMAAQGSARSLERIGRAAALYRGPLLEGCTEEWVFQERRAREQAYRSALQTLAEAAETGRAPERALRYWEMGIGMDPLWDRARRGAMQARAQAGETQAALHLYREFVTLLTRSDPRAMPDAQTVALYEHLRRQAHPLSEGLKRGAAYAAPLVPTPLVTTGGLLHPSTGLVGREDERSEVLAKLRRSRLVTLTGMGGIGKTRLAIAAAQDMAKEAAFGGGRPAIDIAMDTCADAIEMVTLEPDPRREDQGVMPRIAEALGIPEEQTLAHLRTRRMLLVLDNCESVPTAAASAAGLLMRECPGVRLLATAREAMGINGESVWRVPALAVPEPKYLPQGKTTLQRVLSGYEGVQLFLDRAKAAHPAFALTGTNAATVAQICFLLEGIPLAIELAAARVRTLPLEQLAEDLQAILGSGPSLLTSNRFLSAHPQTLRATLNWSYGLLSAAERTLLLHLSTLTGAWSIADAERLRSSAGAASDLRSLVENAFVLSLEREGAQERYRLLEPIRQYAAERMNSDFLTP